MQCIMDDIAMRLGEIPRRSAELSSLFKRYISI